MTSIETCLRRLRSRRISVDLTTPSGVPLKAITVVGRCRAALREAAVPPDEIQAFMDLTTELAQAAAIEGASYEDALADLMNEPGHRVLALAQSYMTVAANW